MAERNNKHFETRDWISITILLMVMLASLADLAADMHTGASPLHMLQEATVVVIALGGLLWIWWSMRRQQHVIKKLQNELIQARALQPQASEELKQTRREFSQAIFKQFVDWQLTSSEQEVGLLLIKGLSFKEVAALRNTTEKTVRQQASSIYKKAGLPGRHAFSAWFIEDFL